MRFLFLALTALSAMAQEDVIHIDQWKAHIGDDPRWATSDFDDHDWANDQLPGSRVAGFRWYRATATIPPALKDQPLALAFGPMAEAFEVYVNGAGVGGLGKLDPVPVSTMMRHLSLDIPPGVGATGTLHIALRRWMSLSSPYFGDLLINGNGSLRHIPQLGPVRLVQTLEQLHALEGEKRAALTQAQIMFGGLVGLLALILFAQRPEQREYLWLGAMFVSGAMSMLTALYVVQFDLPTRSPGPSFSTLLYWCAPACAGMLTRHLCPRLRWPMSIQAGLYLALGVYVALTMMTNQIFYNPIAYLNRFSGVMQVAAAVLIFRDNRRKFALVASLLLVPGVLVLVQFGAIPASYMWKGYEVDLLRTALTIFAVSTLMILWLRSREEQREQQARAQDLAAGQRVQQLLLENTEGTPGFHVEKAYLPAREVGGDFYQFIPRATGGLLVVVGDVSGKGLEAAMLGARLLGALEAFKTLSPGEVLAQLNEAIRGRTSGGFITCCCALFAPDGTVTLANAGHLAPYLDGAEVETDCGLPLGISRDAEYAEHEITVGQGQQLTFVSDGVVEAENATRTLFGFDRTREISRKSAQEIANAAQAWGQTDDITVVTVRRIAGC